jgi:DNA helicase-2/ATP-dependent DNA helicase PcrA
MVEDFINDLNPQQRQAVDLVKGPSVILAGAGSGKTRVLIYKVLNLIENHQVDPYSILMITFTNKAAEEMKKRIACRLGFVGTFHAFCARLLRLEGEAIGLNKNFLIYDENDQLDLLKEILKKREIKKFTPTYFLNRISAAKNQLIDYQRYLELFSDYNAPLVAEIYEQYQKKLEKNKGVDFDDLLFLAVKLFIKNEKILTKYQDRYRYLLVDEFQDTNYAQYTIVRLLGEKYKNITVVGDFSQSIYSWRGADIKNLEKFQEDFPKTKIFYLEENYRSTQKILDFAYQVIAKNQTHPILKLYTKNHQGETVVFQELENEEEEAIFIAQEILRLSREMARPSFAVLYRTNAQSRVIEEAFLHFGLPYILIGGTRFYERKEIKDVLAYLRLLVNPEDSVSLERVKKIGKLRFNKFKEFYQEIKNEIDKKTTNQLIEEIFEKTNYLQLYDITDETDYSRLENIKELKSVAINYPKLNDFLEQVALVESEYFVGEKKRQQKSKQEVYVKLMTLHQAKGLEFPYVFIVGVEEGILPHSRAIDDLFQLEEERRLFYVGITRAQRKLYITYVRRRFIFGHRAEAIKSRFLLESED